MARPHPGYMQKYMHRSWLLCPEPRCPGRNSGCLRPGSPGLWQELSTQLQVNPILNMRHLLITPTFLLYISKFCAYIAFKLFQMLGLAKYTSLCQKKTITFFFECSRDPALVEKEYVTALEILRQNLGLSKVTIVGFR